MKTFMIDCEQQLADGTKKDFAGMITLEQKKSKAFIFINSVGVSSIGDVPALYCYTDFIETEAKADFDSIYNKIEKELKKIKVTPKDKNYLKENIMMVIENHFTF